MKFRWKSLLVAAASVETSKMNAGDTIRNGNIFMEGRETFRRTTNVQLEGGSKTKNAIIMVYGQLNAIDEREMALVAASSRFIIIFVHIDISNEFESKWFELRNFIQIMTTIFKRKNNKHISVSSEVPHVLWAALTTVNYIYFASNATLGEWIYWNRRRYTVQIFVQFIFSLCGLRYSRLVARGCQRWPQSFHLMVNCNFCDDSVEHIPKLDWNPAWVWMTSITSAFVHENDGNQIEFGVNSLNLLLDGST